MSLVVAEVEHGVGQLVVRQGRRRGRREVVRAASAAAVTVRVGLALAHRAHWKQTDTLPLVLCPTVQRHMCEA